LLFFIFLKIKTSFFCFKMFKNKNIKQKWYKTIVKYIISYWFTMSIVSLICLIVNRLVIRDIIIFI
jgi:hypothetical protein